MNCTQVRNNSQSKYPQQMNIINMIICEKVISLKSSLSQSEKLG